MSIPKQNEVNMQDPKQRFLWAFQGIEYNGVPFAAPKEIFEQWSEHLSKAGFVHVSELEGFIDPDVYKALPKQTIHYQPPVRGQDHPMNTSGQWVPVSQPIEEPVVPAVERMTPGEKAKMIDEFREAGLID